MLSRFSLDTGVLSSIDTVDVFVVTVILSALINDSVIEEIELVTAVNAILNNVKRFCQSSWLDINNLTFEVHVYRHPRDHLIYSNGLLFFDSRIVIPPSLRQKMLDALNVAHQGIVKSREKARQFTWWLKIDADIENHVTTCALYAHWYPPPIESMISSQLPELPWQKVITYLFEIDSMHYISVTYCCFALFRASIAHT